VNEGEGRCTLMTCAPPGAGYLLFKSLNSCCLQKLIKKTTHVRKSRVAFFMNSVGESDKISTHARIIQMITQRPIWQEIALAKIPNSMGYLLSLNEPPAPAIRAFAKRVSQTSAH
jgi:hypothetical protein